MRKLLSILNLLVLCCQLKGQFLGPGLGSQVSGDNTRNFNTQFGGSPNSGMNQASASAGTFGSFAGNSNVQFGSVPNSGNMNQASGAFPGNSGATSTNGGFAGFNGNNMMMNSGSPAVPARYPAAVSSQYRIDIIHPDYLIQQRVS